MTLLLNKAYKLLSESTINMNNLHMCDFGRKEKQHVRFQIALPRKFLQAYGTNISFATRMSCQMVVIVRASGEAFPTCLAPISGCILVDVSHMFVQTTLACVRTGTAWAHEALANVFSPGVIGQRADVLKRWTPFSALVWFRKRWRVSSHTRSILST